MSAMHLKFFVFQAGLIAMLATQANSQDFTLANKNATLELNITNSAGISAWKVDGVDNLYHQWFYYRVGASGPESPIENISSSPTIGLTVLSSVTRLNLTYANANFSVLASLKLSGGSAGSGVSNLGEDFTISNLSGSLLDFHFFQYSDFDLFGTIGSQGVQFFQNSANGQYSTVVQSSAFNKVTETLNSGITSIAHFEAAPFNSTIVSLVDGSPTTLGDSQSTSGDATFCYQWDLSLAPGASVQLSTILSIVPEPSSLSILVISALAAAINSRRKANTP